MPDIDPRDVLPQSNLPVPSVPWGRAMQSRLQGVEERVLIDKQDIDGQNRTTAAQLASISEQLNRLAESTYVFVWEGTDTEFPTASLENTPPEWASWGLVSGGMTVIPGVLPPTEVWSLHVDAFTRRAGDPNATQILDWYASDSVLDQMALTSTAVIDVRGGGTIETNILYGRGSGPPADTRFRLSYFIQWVSDSPSNPMSLEI